MLKKIFSTLIVLVFLTLLAGGGTLYWLVVLNPGSEIEPENIQKILGKESPVFFRDGQTRLGVFFDQAHRQYVSIEDIPKNFINALVASEDNRFFSHFGFDIFGIIRAAVKNYQAGKVIQGGSTLTQQTAKNLFKRSGRSYKAKLKELLYALRLEYRYPKEKIFEFYANQFYVSGNGHGLGVAARYYFDKPVDQLTLLECAFIAGSVKRPNYYNPFIKKSGKAVAASHKRAATRVRYVLNKMLELELISSQQYRDAIESDISFNKGKMGFALDYVMEMVKNAVSSQEVLDAMEEHGIDNLATAGLRVITTVDQELQETTLFSLRQELSRLDVRLRGYDRGEVQEELAQTDYKGDLFIKEKAFLFGTIKEISGLAEKQLAIKVDFGLKLGTGIIFSTGVKRLLTAWVKGKKNPWSEVSEGDLDSFLEELVEGDKVWVSVRKLGLDGSVDLELERFPKLQGGALVLEDGLIRSMAGGIENRFFNRAIYARRTMGSAFKPLVYAAALQLGWNTTDLLQNKRDIFVFQSKSYFPRPDHKNENKEVSMSWAGVRSENLASVWLLYHLLDYLEPNRFIDVCKQLQFYPRVLDGEEEPYRSYRARIRDRYGIVINQAVLRKAAFYAAVKNLRTDFMFENRLPEYETMNELHYGLDFPKFSEEIDLELEKEELKDYQIKELLLRKNLLADNYLSLLELQKEFRRYQAELADPWNEFDTFVSSELPGARLYYDPVKQFYSFESPERNVVHLQPVDRSKLQEFIFRQDMAGQKKFWSEIRLNSKISNAALTILTKQIDREFDRLKALPPYSIEVLSVVQDFRILVGMHYLIGFGKEAGIRSKLEPVLSFPLGSNVVTLLETVRLYQALVTGEVSLSGKNEENQDLLCIIDRIESDEGIVLFRPKRRHRQLLAKESRLALGHLLENVVKFGTGRYADKHVRVSGKDEGISADFQGLDFSIPILGKTGTANRYTNASFFGYLPGLAPRGDGMVIDGGFTVGVYVGFDKNKAMRKRATRITGSSGALPTWSNIVNGLLNTEGYRKSLDPVDLSFYGLSLKRDELGQHNLKVSAAKGGKLLVPISLVDEKDRYQQSILTFGTITSEKKFNPSRKFVPFWGSDEYLVEKDL